MKIENIEKAAQLLEDLNGMKKKLDLVNLNIKYGGKMNIDVKCPLEADFDGELKPIGDYTMISFTPHETLAGMIRTLLKADLENKIADREEEIGGLE